MESLVKTVSKQEDAASIFKRAPKKDVLDNRNGHYAIPSMFDWGSWTITLSSGMHTTNLLLVRISRRIDPYQPDGFYAWSRPSSRF